MQQHNVFFYKMHKRYFQIGVSSSGCKLKMMKDLVVASFLIFVLARSQSIYDEEDVKVFVKKSSACLKSVKLFR